MEASVSCWAAIAQSFHLYPLLLQPRSQTSLGHPAIPLSLQVPKATTAPSLQPGKFPELKSELQQSDTIKSPSPEAAELPAWCWVRSPAAGWSQLKMLQVNSLHPGALLLLWLLTKERELLEARTGMMGIS